MIKPVKPPGSKELQAYFDLLKANFQQAVETTSSAQDSYDFGSLQVKIRFAGPGLGPMLKPAISHAISSEPINTDFEIFAWDSASTHCELSFMLAQHIQLLKNHWGTYLDSRGGIPHLTGNDIYSTMHLGAAGVSLSVYNVRKHHALFWTENAALIPYYEQGAPFRTIINWMINQKDHFLAHAGAVGMPNGGVLLAGKGGSGKSTTALACLRKGLSFASDDYILVELGNLPVAYCLYNTAKLVGYKDLERFPELGHYFELRDQLDPKSKPMAFLFQHLPEQVIKKMPLKAIFLPRINDKTHTSLRPAGAAAALAAIAPNSIFQLPGTGQQTITAIGRLTKSLPCFWLEVGTNLNEIPALIIDYLNHQTGV